MSDNTPFNPAPGSAQAIAEWLAYNEAELIRRRDEELIPALQRLNKVPPGASFPIIADHDEDLAGVFVENEGMAAALLKTANEHRLAEGKPYRDGQSAINAWFERFGKPLEDAMAPITKARFDYQRRKAEESRRQAQAEAARAAEEARKAQEAAAKAMKRNPLSSDVDLRLEEAGRKAEEAARAQELAAAPLAEHSRVRGVYGRVSSIRTTWGWEVEDIDKVPRQYLMVDPDAIKEAARKRDANNRPVAVIPGIKWIEKQGNEKERGTR